ncbi:MAG: hypothetical protein RLZ44_1881 [Pseudomonadota bacterium]
MKIEQLEVRPYRLSLRRPWRTARGIFTRRCGWLVRVSAEGMSGYGDCAPLPQAGTESLISARRALAAYQRQLPGLPVAAIDLDDEGAAVDGAAARCAVASALLDLRARLAGVPLWRLLASEATQQVEVNAALGALDEGVMQRAGTAVAAGYRVLKLKVGLNPVAQELRRLRELGRALPPQVGLRLDANGAWDPDAARAFVSGLAELPVESLEEPLRHPDPRQLRELQDACPFALALDESLPRQVGQGDLSRLPVRRLVLKPGVLGGPLATRRLAQAAAAAGIEVVLTSLVESAAGVWPAVQLAATLPAPVAHGLATSAWLADDLGAPPEVRQGAIALPSGAGSGFHPAAAVLAAAGLRRA